MHKNEHIDQAFCKTLERFRSPNDVTLPVRHAVLWKSCRREARVVQVKDLAIWLGLLRLKECSEMFEHSQYSGICP